MSFNFIVFNEKDLTQRTSIIEGETSKIALNNFLNDEYWQKETKDWEWVFCWVVINKESWFQRKVLIEEREIKRRLISELEERMDILEHEIKKIGDLNG